MPGRSHWFEGRRLRLGLLVAALVAAAAGTFAVLNPRGDDSPAEPIECDLSGATPTPIAPPLGMPPGEARDRQFFDELQLHPDYGGQYLKDSTMFLLTTGETCGLEQLFARYNRTMTGWTFGVVDYSYPDMYALQLRVVEDIEVWRALGVMINSVGVRVIENRLGIGVSDRTWLAATFLRGTYGEMVVVTEEGPYYSDSEASSGGSRLDGD